jgi:uncharacterized protein (TIGR00251 family)
MQDRPWSATADGLRLMVRLTPRSGRDSLGGLREIEPGQPLLLARVAAAPVEGQANASLVKLLARTLGVPKSAVTIAAGETSRIKAVDIAGDPARLAAALEALI